MKLYLVEDEYYPYHFMSDKSYSNCEVELNDNDYLIMTKLDDLRCKINILFKNCYKTNELDKNQVIEILDMVKEIKK